MKNNKRILALLLALVMMVSLFAGCAKEEAPVQDVEAPVEETPVSAPGAAHHVNAYGYPSYSIHFTSTADGAVYDYMNEAGELVSVSAEEVEALLAEEVASCAGITLTNRDLPYYFSESYYELYQAYGYLLSFIMNTQAGLDEQMHTDGTTTWQGALLEGAVEIFGRMAAVVAAAQEEGFDMTAVNEEVEAYRQQIVESAQQVGYTDVDQFLSDYFTPGTTEESYMDYYAVRALYTAYLEKLANEQEVSEEEIDAYYAANEESLAGSGVTKVDKNVVDVRHILIKPEETVAEDGTTSISDEAWAAAEAEANRIYDTWKSGEATEDFFAELATEFTQDPGSQETGGLYEDVYPGQMVTEFNDWCFADGRTVGDHGVVKTTYGYHIMFFSGEGDFIYWRKTVKDTIVNELVAEIVKDLQAASPLTQDLSKAILLEAMAPTAPLAAEETEESTEHVDTEDCEHEAEEVAE